ncbi:MAG: homoserine kinase [Steroidobacteraceae bacterium]
MIQTAQAFAPASAGNVAIGFDILGFAIDALGDTVTVNRTDTPGVEISGCSGLVEQLPTDPLQNTAGAGLVAMQRQFLPDCGMAVHIHKGIPLGSGLGGSAASAVAAVVAANALLPKSLPDIELLKFAMQGERVSSGSLHVDNISPSLFGGLVLTVGVDDPRVKRIPVPTQIRAVIVHPHIEISTRSARALLKGSVEMADFVWQTANLAGFISGCYTNDLELIREGLNDIVIERQRKALIPGFDAVRAAALDSGAIGCSISGAGPSVFAWVAADRADMVGAAMATAFTDAGLASDSWTVDLAGKGAHVISSR